MRIWGNNRNKKILIAAAASAALCAGAFCSMLAAGGDFVYRVLPAGHFVRACDYRALAEAYREQGERVSNGRAESGAQSGGEGRPGGKGTENRSIDGEEKPIWKSGTVKRGDTIRLSYAVSSGGTPCLQYNAADQVLRVGEGTLPEEVEQAIIGSRTGKIIRVRAQIPQDSGDRILAGQMVDFEIGADAILQMDSKEGKGPDEATDKEKREELWEEILTESEVRGYPKKLLARETSRQIIMTRALAACHNMNWESYLEDILKTDADGFHRQTLNHAKRNVLSKLLAHHIARREHVRLTEEEWRDWKDAYFIRLGASEPAMAEQVGMSEKRLEEYMGLRSMALIDQVKEYLYEQGGKREWQR